MPLSQKEITVGGKQYVIEQLPTSRGLEVLVSLAHVLAGAAKGIGESSTESVLDTPFNIGQIIAGLIERLDQKATPILIKALVRESVVRPELTDDIYELTFSGSYDDLWEMIEKILEHNKFGDVLKKRLHPIFARLLSGGVATDSKSTPSTTSP